MAERPATRKSNSGNSSTKASAARSTAKATSKSTSIKSKSVKSSSAKKAPRMGKSYSPEDRWKMIADAAFFKAERRGFAPGGEVADWLAAEMEVDALLMGKARKSAKAS